eukprot:245762-Prorocentrum_minimum.AAC.3
MPRLYTTRTSNAYFHVQGFSQPQRALALAPARAAERANRGPSEEKRPAIECPNVQMFLCSSLSRSTDVVCSAAKTSNTPAPLLIERTARALRAPSKIRHFLRSQLSE